MLQRFYQSIIILPLILGLSGCLATSELRYDPPLVETLNQVSAETFTLFASIEDGVTAKDFAERQQQYYTLIGQYESLVIRANSRPYPQQNQSDTHSKSVTVTQIPSVTALESVSKTLTKMKSTDQKQGLTKTEVAVFKELIRLQLDQTITFEQHLKPY